MDTRDTGNRSGPVIPVTWISKQQPPRGCVSFDPVTLDVVSYWDPAHFVKQTFFSPLQFSPLQYPPFTVSPP